MSYLIETFITNNNIVCNKSIGYKCTLHWRNDLGEDRFHSICNSLSYDSINYITQAYRPVIRDSPRLSNFRDQYDKSMVKRRRVTLLIKDM